MITMQGDNPYYTNVRLIGVHRDTLLFEVTTSFGTRNFVVWQEEIAKADKLESLMRYRIDEAVDATRREAMTRAILNGSRFATLATQSRDGSS